MLYTPVLYNLSTCLTLFLYTMQTLLFSVPSTTLVSDTIKIHVRAICVAAGVRAHSYIDYTVKYESRVPTIVALWHCTGYIHIQILCMKASLKQCIISNTVPEQPLCCNLVPTLFFIPTHMHLHSHLHIHTCTFTHAHSHMHIHTCNTLFWAEDWCKSAYTSHRRLLL